MAAWSRGGRAGGQPLFQKATADYAPYSSSVPLEHSFQFVTALFENLLRLPTPLAREERKQVLVYNNASFIWQGLRSESYSSLRHHSPNHRYDYVCLDQVTASILLPLYAKRRKYTSMQAESSNRDCHLPFEARGDACTARDLFIDNIRAL